MPPMTRFKIDGGNGNGFSPGSFFKEQPQAKIDPSSEEDLLKWERSLQIDRKTLLQAMKDYGPGVRDIRRGLVKEKAA